MSDAEQKPQDKVVPMKPVEETKADDKLAPVASAKPKAKPAPKKKPVVKKKAKPAANAKPKTAAPKAKKPAKTNVFDMMTTPKAMEKTMTNTQAQMEKATQDAADMARENAEAFMKSGTIFMKGYEEMMRTAVEMSQKAAERQSQFMQDMMSAKNMTEMTSKQNEMAQASFDDFMEGATKMSEMGAKVLTDSAEPMNTQMSKAVEKATKSMAA